MSKEKIQKGTKLILESRAARLKKSEKNLPAPIIEEYEAEHELENLADDDLIAGLEEIPQKTLGEDLDEGIDHIELPSLPPLAGRAEVLQSATAEPPPVDRSKKTIVDLQEQRERLQSTATSVEEAVDNFEELFPPPPLLTEKYPVLKERVQKVLSEKPQSIGGKFDRLH